MFTRHVLNAIVSLSLFLTFCSPEVADSVATDTAMTNVQALEEADLFELQNQIRKDKLDIILPHIMRENKIDMWIQVMRELNPDPIGADLGSNSGVFIFTDRGGDRIERAFFGRSSELIRESGFYDIINEEGSRVEMPGGPETELDHRFKGVGEFVAKRDPKRIGVNYLEKLGTPLAERPRSDGISYTDYNLLVKALGDKYAERMVSAEYLIMDFISRGVESEIVLFKKMREWISESLESDFDKIVPGVTKFGDLEGGDTYWSQDGDRNNNKDYVLQRGDLIKLEMGQQETYNNFEWKFGNFFEVVWIYGYILREGETEPPPKIKKLWTDALTIRKVLEDNIKVGRTAGETFEILKRYIEDEGLIYVNRQLFYKELDPDKTQFTLDLHAAGKGRNAPRISPLGPDWQRDMKIPLNHHFYFEFFVYMPMPEWGEGKYLHIGLHDGAIVTERGVEYFAPPPREIRLIR